MISHVNENSDKSDGKAGRDYGGVISFATGLHRVSL